MGYSTASSIEIFDPFSLNGGNMLKPSILIICQITLQLMLIWDTVLHTLHFIEIVFG